MSRRYSPKFFLKKFNGIKSLFVKILKALKFYSSLRLRVSKAKEGMLKEKHGAEEVVVGQAIRVRVVKNKTASPFKTAEFKVYFDGRTVDECDEIAEIALSKALLPRYNAKGELTDTGRQYKWPNEPNFLAKSKGEVAEQIRLFPNVREELKAIIASGNFEEHQFNSEIMDADMSDEDFEESIKNQTISEDEDEEDDWENKIK